MKTGQELDLIWGAAAIAKELNLNQRQVFFMLETGTLPARKVGNRWVADRSRLRRFFLEETIFVAEAGL